MSHLNKNNKDARSTVTPKAEFKNIQKIAKSKIGVLLNWTKRLRLGQSDIA